MAYAFTVAQISQETIERKLYTVMEITETDAAIGDEWSVGAPGIGRVTLIEGSLTAGTGTTIQTELGRLAAWTTAEQGHIDQVAAAAKHFRVGTDKRYSTADDVVYGRSLVDAGADNTIVTRLTFVRGHL